MIQTTGLRAAQGGIDGRSRGAGSAPWSFWPESAAHFRGFDVATLDALLLRPGHAPASRRSPAGCRGRDFLRKLRIFSRRTRSSMTPLPRSISRSPRPARGGAGGRSLADCERVRRVRAKAVHRRLHLAEDTAARVGDEEPGGQKRRSCARALTVGTYSPSARKFPQQRVKALLAAQA